MKRLLGLLGLLAGLGVRAALPPGCEDVPLQDGLPATPLAIDARLRAEPALALQAACSAWPAAPEADRRWLQALAADAHYTLSRTAQARAALQPLQADVDDERQGADWRAHWHLVVARIAIDETDYAVAARHFDRSVALLRQAGRLRTRAGAQALLGQAHSRRIARDLPAAEQLAAEAEAILVEAGLARSLDMADVLNTRTMLAYARQDLPGTARLARAEIDLAREIGRGDDPELLHSYATLGAVLSQLARFAEADAALREALAIIARHPDDEPSGQVGVYTNLAMLHVDQGRHDDAREPAERAVARAEQLYGRDSPRLLVPLLARGTVALRSAHYAAAQTDLQRALQLAERHRASVGALRGLRLRDLLAGLYTQLGELDTARSMVEGGLGEAGGDPQLGYWRGRLLRRQALLDARAGRHEAADRALGEARTLIGPVIGDEHAYVTSLISDRCEAQLQLGGAAPACAEVRGRLEGLATAAPGFRFRAHAVLARQDTLRGDSDAALKHHLAALAAAEADGAADPRWPALDGLAQHLRAQGRPELAVFFGKQALVAIEALRREASAALASSERSFLVDKVAVYRRVADWLAEDGRLAEALQTMQLLKEEEFLEYLQRRSGLAGGAEPLALTERERRLLARWPVLQAAARESAGGGEADWAQRADRALREWVASAEHPPAAPGPRAVGAPARDELFVHALASGAHLTLLFESRSGLSARRIEWDRAAAGREIGQLLGALGRGEPATAPLQAMYRRLGAPIDEAARAAGARRIVLDVDGALRYVPMAALHDGRQPLGARYTFVHRVPAADAAAARTGTPAASLVAVGVSRPPPGQPPLPGVAREVCAIVDGPVVGLAEGEPACGPQQGIVPGSGYLNERFTWQRLADAASRGGERGALLHVGTHFDLRPGHIGRSSLLMGDGSRLTLDTLAQLDFRGTELVTLSACETGLGGGTGADGREVEGLNLLLLRRGARAVLATLWRVDDDSTSALMRAFYRELSGAEPAEALRRAQAALRADSRWASPFHWAAFYVTSR